MAYRNLTEREQETLRELAEGFREKVAPVVDKINKLCEKENCSAHVQSGYRTSQKQLQLYKRGRKQLNGRWVRTGKPVVTHAPPGQSPHEYRLAVHVALVRDDDNHWIDDEDPRWHSLVGKTVREAKLTWGGDFVNIFDAAHIEDPNWRETAQDLGWRGLQ